MNHFNLILVANSSGGGETPLTLAISTILGILLFILGVYFVIRGYQRKNIWMILVGIFLTYLVGLFLLAILSILEPRGKKKEPTKKSSSPKKRKIQKT